MAQCKMCGRKGFLLSVSANGLCRPCDAVFVLAVQQRGRVVWDCMKLINESKNTETRLSRCDLLIEHAQALLQYENMGIYTVNPSPSQLLSQYTSIRAQLGGEETTEEPRVDKAVRIGENGSSRPNAECPYCRAFLQRLPQRKTRCPSCGHHIYVRTRPSDRQRILVTEDTAKQIDSEWAETAEQRNYERVLRYLTIDSKEYDKAKIRLTKKLGEPPTPRAVAWDILDDHLARAIRQSDWQRMKMLYFEQARILYEEGGAFFPILQEAARCELHCYESQGVKRVEVYTTGCEACKRMNGKVLTVKAALHSMPIPVKECENGWCRCTYVPTVD